jgi:hypothetical protein
MKRASILLCSLLCASAIHAGPSRNILRQQLGPAEHAALQTRLGQLNNDIATRGLHDFPGAHGRLLTGYVYGEFYDWDLYFENVYLSYYGVSTYDFTNLQVFLDRQHPDGFISRTLAVKWSKPHQMFKPFLAQLAVLGSRQRGSFEWLRAQDYARLKLFVQRWMAYDNDHNGLPVWNSADATGMDNETSRAGKLDTYDDEGVDLACYLVREMRAMAVIANALGEKADAAHYTAQADHLAERINKVFWDDKDGFYYDRNEKTGQLIRIKSVSGFLPLWAGVAPPARARRLVREHLMNPREFWLTYPVATYAATEPGFYEGRRRAECNWRGPAWIPTNYMIFHGLIDYGYKTEARELADRTLHMVLNQNPVTREFYDSQTGLGYGMNPFWGWSSLGYVMPLDDDDHYNPMDLHKPIVPLISQTMNIHFPPTT